MDRRQSVLWTLLVTVALIQGTCGWRPWQAEEDFLNAVNSNKRRHYIGINMENDNMNNGAFNVGRKYYIRPHVDSNSKADDSKEHNGDDSDCSESHEESHEESGEQSKPLPTVPSQRTSSTAPSSSQTRWHSEASYSRPTESQQTVVVSTTAASIAPTTSQTQQPDELSIATEIHISTETPESVKVSTSTLTSTEIQQAVEVTTTAATILETLKPSEFINVPTSVLTNTETHQPEDVFTSAAPTSETLEPAEVSTTILPLELETEQRFEGSASEAPSAATTLRAQPVEISTTPPLTITSTETLPLWKFIQIRKQHIKEIINKPETYYRK